MGLRKNQAGLTSQEKSRYVAAVVQLKANGTYDDYVRQHRDAMQSPAMPAHRMPAFLPWHREFLRRFELDLQAIDPSVTIPYWDWTTDRSHAASFWASNFMGGDGEPGTRRVTTGRFAFSSGQWTLNVTTPDAPGPALRRRLGDPDALPTRSQVLSVLARVPYDSSPWMGPSNGFRSALENLHDGVHPWVGGSVGSMGGPTSPNDPVFFLHHSNIDRLWAQWQLQNPSQAAYLPATGADVGQNLNDPMSPWGGATSPASVLNHRVLGYWYDTDPVSESIIDLTVGAPPATAAIGRAGEVDVFSFRVTTVGVYTIETTGQTDIVMALSGPNDLAALVSEDDDSGQNRNARIASSLSAGTYYISIRHFNPQSTGSYRISVVRDGAPVTIPELEVSGPTLQGRIAAANESDLYTFSASSSGVYSVRTTGNTDTFLSLFGPNSQSRLIAQDDDSGPGANSRIDADLSAGVYFARVRHFDPGGTGSYRISVRR